MLPVVFRATAAISVWAATVVFCERHRIHVVCVYQCSSFCLPDNLHSPYIQTGQQRHTRGTPRAHPGHTQGTPGAHPGHTRGALLPSLGQIRYTGFIFYKLYGVQYVWVVCPSDCVWVE